jgi:hypothetical protein
MTSVDLEIALPADAGGVFAALASAYTVLAEPSEVVEFTYLDTVDWRLHRAGLSAREATIGRHANLELVRCEAPELSSAGRRHNWPVRAEKLHGTAVGDLVAETAGSRAVLALARVQSRRLTMKLLDEAGKIRVRVIVDQQRLLGPRPTPLPMRVGVHPLRGYERDGHRCVQLLKDAMVLDAEPGFAALTALAAAGRVPSDPEARTIAVDGADPVARSVAVALRHWLAVIELNRDGVLADLDAECLLDFGTGVHRSLELLALFPDALGGEAPQHAADELAWLSGLSRPAGESAQSLAGLRSGPVDLSDLHLDAVFSQLERHRRRDVHKLRQALRSERFETLLRDWYRALDRFAAGDALGRDTRGEIGERLVRAHESAQRACAERGDDVCPLYRTLWQLDCLLRSFGGLYAAAQVRAESQPVAKLLKRAESARRCEAQRVLLTQTANRLRGRGAPVTDLLAIGAARDRLESRARDIETKLSRAVAAYAGEAGTARFAAMLDSVP